MSEFDALKIFTIYKNIKYNMQTLLLLICFLHLQVIFEILVWSEELQNVIIFLGVEKHWGVEIIWKAA